jgi:hypothetical protein
LAREIRHGRVVVLERTADETAAQRRTSAHEREGASSVAPMAEGCTLRDCNVPEKLAVQGLVLS